RAHVQEPIPIHADRCRTPRTRHSFPRQGSRELREQLLTPSQQRSLSHGGQCLDGLFVEVALRHRRVGLSLAPEEAPDIPAIFEQQCIRFIFRMALEKDEQALCLLHERVDARMLRPREHPIAARGQGVLTRSERSEEHTSELQSRFDLVCRLLLEKKKKNKTPSHTTQQGGTAEIRISLAVFS